MPTERLLGYEVPSGGAAAGFPPALSPRAAPAPAGHGGTPIQHKGS
jgi:hypothetical protein